MDSKRSSSSAAAQLCYSMRALQLKEGACSCSLGPSHGPKEQQGLVLMGGYSLRPRKGWPIEWRCSLQFTARDSKGQSLFLGPVPRDSRSKSRNIAWNHEILKIKSRNFILNHVFSEKNHGILRIFMKNHGIFKKITEYWPKITKKHEKRPFFGHFWVFSGQMQPIPGNYRAITAPTRVYSLADRAIQAKQLGSRLYWAVWLVGCYLGRPPFSRMNGPLVKGSGKLGQRNGAAA